MANYDKDTVKASVAISQYLDDNGIPRKGNRAVAKWRGGKNLNVSIDDRKGTWYDHKTKEHGDIFTLFAMVEGGSFKTALHTLGERYHIPECDASSATHSTWRPRHLSAIRLTDAEKSEIRRKRLPQELRQFVPFTLYGYRPTTSPFKDIIGLHDGAYLADGEKRLREEAAMQLRAMFRQGERIWAGWIVKDEETRKRIGLRLAKTDILPRGIDTLDPAGIRGIVEAHTLAARIEAGEYRILPTHISLNPVTGSKGNGESFDDASTIAAYRHVLLEFDHLADIDPQGMKIPSQTHTDTIAGLERYADEMKATGHGNALDPIAGIYTGGKSIHVALRVKADDLEEYKKQTAALKDIFMSADDENFRIDPAGWDNGYTHIRLAGAIRPETGKAARILFCHG